MVLQAGGSEPGQALAARTADVVFSVVQDIDEAKAAYASLKKRVPAFGRSPEHVTVLPGVMPVVGRTDKEAREKLAVLQSFVTGTNALQLLSDRLGQDMTRYDLDGPVPDLAADRQLSHELRPRHARQGPAREHDPARPLQSHRRRARPLGAVRLGRDDRRHAAAVVRRARRRRLQRHAAVLPEGFDDFVDLVVPILQERGLFRRDYEGETLRDHLGLPRPPSRFYG